MNMDSCESLPILGSSLVTFIKKKKKKKKEKRVKRGMRGG